MAARFWRGTGDGNWGSGGVGGNWSTTSGGATGAAVPTSADDVTFDSAGNNNCTLNTSSRVCKSFTVTSGYTVTITHTQALTVSGNITFNNTHTIAGTGTLLINSTSTITTNGQTWPNNLTLTGAFTYTLSGNFVVGGSTTVSSLSTMNATVAETFSTAGLTTNNYLSGTVVTYLTGGTWGGVNTTGLGTDLVFAGDVTLSTNVYKNGGKITYSSGTITSAGSTLNILGGTITFDTNGMAWNNILSPNVNWTYTLNSLLTVTGTFTTSTTATHVFTGTAGFTIGTFLCNITGASTITLKESLTYTITDYFNCYKSRTGSIVLFTSSHASNKAILTLPNNGSNLCNVLASFTRIDASAGRSINTFAGTITDCLNINQFFDYKPYAA